MKDNDSILITLASLRHYFVQAVFFSCIINLLSLALPIYSMQVLDRVLNSSSLETLIYLSIIVFASVFTMSIINDVRSGILEYIGGKLYSKLLNTTLNGTMKDSVHKNVGFEYIKDLNHIKNFLCSQHFVSLIDLPWAIIFLIVIFYIHWICGLLILIASVILVVIAFVGQKVLLHKFEKINERESIFMSKLQIFTRNFESILGMGMTKDVFNFCKQEEVDISIKKNNSLKSVKFISLITKIFRYSVQILITFISALLIIKGKMSSGGMIAVSMLASKVLSPFDLSAAIVSSLASFKKSYHRLKNVFQRYEEESDRISLPPPCGTILCENVVFYAETIPIIKGISFSIMQGEVVGIIGKSGSGKTTLVRLIVGILIQNRGTIKFDDADISLWKKEDLGKHIGYLPQNFELLPVSIKQNICRMQKDAKDADIIAASKLANVHELILSFKEGYETIISDTNLNLSAGQRQRIALARCFYGNSRILILDEPNSNLDLEGEAALLNAILNAKNNGKTVIIISHKQTILSATDKILIIQNGEVAHFGERDKILKAIGAT